MGSLTSGSGSTEAKRLKTASYCYIVEVISGLQPEDLISEVFL